MRLAAWFLPILGTQWHLLAWFGPRAYRYAAGGFVFAWVDWCLAAVMWVRWLMMRLELDRHRRLAAAEYALNPVSHYKMHLDGKGIDAVHVPGVRRPLYDGTMGSED